MLNKLPREYVENDTHVALNPTKQNPGEIDISSMPLAGHFSGIGQKILDLGSRKAVHMTTMNWGLGASINENPNRFESRSQSTEMQNRSSPNSRPMTTVMSIKKPNFSGKLSMGLMNDPKGLESKLARE